MLSFLLVPTTVVAGAVLARIGVEKALLPQAAIRPLRLLMHCSTSSARRLRLALVLAGVCIALAPALANPLLFDPTMPDPRTAGELPPGQTAPAEPLRPSVETPGGGLWLRGEVPSGAVDPNHALRSARAEVGARLPLVTGAGFGWEVKPVLAGAAAAAVMRPEPSVVSPQVGFALGQAFSLSLPFGLRLGAEGVVGDRLGVGGLSSAAAAPVSSALAMRAGVTLSTDLALPFLQTPLRIGLGFATVGTLPGTGLSSAMADALPDPGRGAAGRGWFEAEDCTASLEVGRVRGAPLRVSARCPVAPGAVPPVTFGFRTEF